MTEQIQVEELVKELEKKTGYRTEDPKDPNSYHYKWTWFVFDKDNVEIHRTQGYAGEEDMSDEWFGGDWHCTIPRQTVYDSLSKLVRRSYTELRDIETKKRQVKEELDKKGIVTLAEMANEYEKVTTITEELKDVDVTETYSGRGAYGIPQDSTTRNYRTNLEIKLRMDEKPAIELANPSEMRNAGSL